MRAGGYVFGVGAANLDIHGKCRFPVLLADSNPGHMSISCGGVTRNILENLARLGVDARMAGAVGDDLLGQKILADSSAAGIDMSGMIRLAGHSSSTYMTILGPDGEMVAALSDMSIMESLDEGFFRRLEPVIAGAELIVCDPCLPPRFFGLLMELARERPIFCDPVSVAYAKTLVPFTGLCHTIKPNPHELSVLAGMDIETDDQLAEGCLRLLGLGVKQVVVSLGSRGCCWAAADGIVHFSSLRPVENMANASGAGDAFMAGLALGYLERRPLSEAVHLALAAGAVAVRGEGTINTGMSRTLLQSTLEELLPQ